MSSAVYCRVCEDEDSEPVEVPLEGDQTLLLPTLAAQFPKCTGLKYKPDNSSCFRGLRLVGDRIYPPADNGWGNNVFYCVFPKGSKRKGDEDDEDSKPKLKCVDGRKCTDLIVLNLPWHTDELKLRNYFSKFGEVVMVQIKRDPTTGKSRGYGFLRFADYSGQVMCLAEQHIIDNRQCEVRIPLSKAEGDRQEVNRKIHVGRLTDDIGIEALRNHFSQYGTVTDVFIPKPFRSFAFVTFDDPDVAASLMGEEMTIEKCNVVIGSAVPKLPAQGRQSTTDNVFHSPGLPLPGQQDGSPYWNNLNHPRSGIPQTWPPTFGMFSNAPPPPGHPANGRGPANGPMGLSPVTAAAAAALAAQYTQAHQRQNAGLKGEMRNPNMGPQTGGGHPNSNAAMATLNILNNPNVVAAIVSAAAGAMAPNSAAFSSSMRR